MNKYYKVIIFVILLACFVGLAVYLKPIRKTGQPNVILIVLDSLRPDHLGCYGYKRDTSTNIDKFAKEGVIFNQAISQIPETQSSVASFLTSSRPFLHYRSYHGDWSYLNPQIPTLAAILRNYDYQTGLFTDFREPDEILRIRRIMADFDTYYAVTWNNPKKLSQAALSWLKRNRNAKFFLYLHYFGVHAPYNPSLPYSKTYLNDKYNNIKSKVPIAASDRDIIDVISYHTAEEGITDIDYYICKYDGKLRILDAKIGLLLRGIKKLGLDNNTLVILIADHGESLGEHRLYFRHVYTLFEELIRVPLIIRYPPLFPKYKVVSHPVQLIDIAPTILDILGIKDPAYDNMEGISLMPFISENKEYPVRYAFGMGCFRSKYYVRTDTWKLIYEDYQKVKDLFPEFDISSILKAIERPVKSYRLYNLKDDPKEMCDLSGQEIDKFVFLKEKLDAYVKEAERQTKIAEINLGTEKIGTLDGEIKEKLRALGYVQ